jgi:hypothetical protein
VTQGGTNAGQLARRDARTDATAAHEHPSIRCSRDDRAADGGRDVGIVVARYELGWTAVDELEPSCLELLEDARAQRPASMITSECHFHTGMLAREEPAGNQLRRRERRDPLSASSSAERPPAVTGVTEPAAVVGRVYGRD